MIVFVLRHGERKPDPEDALTSEGKQRAKLLARMLRDSGVTIAYRSDHKRTGEMLDPLGENFAGALTVHTIPIKTGGPDAHVANVVEAVKAVKTSSPDAVIAVVTYNITVGPIVEGLGGGTVAVEEHEFDKLFVLFIGPGVRLLKLRYGA